MAVTLAHTKTHREGWFRSARIAWRPLSGKGGRGLSRFCRIKAGTGCRMSTLPGADNMWSSEG